tara:strand:+ start:617 stop:904 length:288 start_codon:yes stop_codon:yes gene_type:complete
MRASASGVSVLASPIEMPIAVVDSGLNSQPAPRTEQKLIHQDVVYSDPSPSMLYLNEKFETRLKRWAESTGASVLGHWHPIAKAKTTLNSGQRIH